jgi:hypothetical protein
MAASSKRESPGKPRTTSRKAPRKAGAKQAARGTPSKASTLEAKNAGVSKGSTSKIVNPKIVEKAEVACKVRPSPSKGKNGDNTLVHGRRRSGRNNRDSSISAEEPPNASSIHTRGATPKPAQAKNGKGVKSQHTDVVAETHLVAAQKAVTLGEGGTEEVLRRARHALEVQDAERRAYNGLKSVGCGAVVPRPTLQLSSMDELVTSFRNGLPGAEKSFQNYFLHPYQAGGSPQLGQTLDLRRRRQNDVDWKESSPGNAEATPHLSSAGAVKSPSPSHGDRPILGLGCQSSGMESALMARSPSECPPAKRHRYDMLVVHRFAMAAKGRRSRRAVGRRVKYTESDVDNSDVSSEYCVGEDGGLSSDSGSESELKTSHNEVCSYTWQDIFPEDMEMDERCYRSVGAALPFKTVGLPKRPTESTAAVASPCITAPCVVAPMDRVRHRASETVDIAAESTQSLCEIVDATVADVDCAVSGPNIPVDAVDAHGPEYRRRLIKAINSGNGSALDHFATALCQVIKPTVSTDAPPAVPPAGTEFLHSSWTLEVKDTYTWYSGYDVVHGMSYIHPLVLHDFVPVHPLYHGDSPRVKWQGPIGKLPRMDPSKDYLRASLQYLRACAVKVGNLPCPPMQVQKLVARQYQHFESMLDRVREVRRQQQPGGGPMHKNVRVNPMIGRKALLLTPLLFSPRHLLVGEDPSGQSDREFVSRRNFTPVSPGTSALLIPADAQEESKTREPIVSLYDKDLEQPLYRGKRPLRTSDMPPPYPVFKANEPLVGKRKVVYRTRVPESTAPVAPGDSAMSRRSKAGGPLAQVPNAPLPPPRAAPPLTQKELNAINRKKERELRAYERRMRLRAEMGEEAWAAEQRRKEEYLLKKKIQYQTTKKCKDAIEWTQDAAKLPTTQTFNQHMVIERVNRAVQVIREMHLKKQQNLYGRQIVHYEKDGGVFVRLRTPDDDEEIARLVAEHEEQEREEIAAALDAQEARKRKRVEDNQANSTRDTGTGTATGTAEASSQNPASSSSGNGSDSDGNASRSTSKSLRSD